ncbi:hypothetical protein A0J48_006735 [Sphaerospermopsis aphanizomenoides BCCUSP55]|nr:hypothetical protein [Sphaerospermopsis aphanizomenoides BCCUSP55]
MGIKSQTLHYNYFIKTTKTSAYSYGIPRSQNNKSVIGGVFIVPAQEKSEMTTVAIVCESNLSANKEIAVPIYDHENGLATCGAGTKELRR